MLLTITGSVPSKKNSRISTASGRTFPNKAYVDWEKDALKQLHAQLVGSEQITAKPVKLTVQFIVKDKVHRDMDNMLASILDVLKDQKKKLGGKMTIVRKGVIADDSWLYVNPITVSVIGVDKLNPRVNIWLDY